MSGSWCLIPIFSAGYSKRNGPKDSDLSKDAHCLKSWRAFRLSG